MKYISGSVKGRKNSDINKCDDDSIYKTQSHNVLIVRGEEHIHDGNDVAILDVFELTKDEVK